MHVCCGYQIIHFAQGCDLGCSYCILSYYLKGSPLTVFYNREKLFYELEQFLEKKKRLTRFGTGEFTDSLLFEEDFPLYSRLIPSIAGRKNAVLEIKTKTVNIDELLQLKERENIIVSWSLNSESIAQREERNVSTISARIDAARRVEQAGYKLAFHFDPIVVYEGWEEEYKKTVDLLFNKVRPENVVYVSMGTLRFIPQMKAYMEQSGAGYTNGEFIQGIDNKMRYFRPIRTRAYRIMKSFLIRFLSEDILYLCMESPYVWEDVFGIKNMTTHALIDRLDRACYDTFDSLSE